MSHRPDRISERAEFSHWECDLMICCKEHEKVNVTLLAERVSRYTVVVRNEGRQSKPILEALINGLAPLPADVRQATTTARIRASTDSPRETIANGQERTKPGTELTEKRCL